VKHFLVEITYAAALDAVDAAVAAHRNFLQTGYDRGWLLMSGPRTPRTGGIVLARAPSQQAIESFFRDDPFMQQGLATYRYTEFTPVKHQNFMVEWCKAGNPP
jgi:uncharacterized protein YciI